MKRILLLFAGLFAFVSISNAETAPVSIRLTEEKAWIGQRLPFFIELRAAGSFDGAASFDLPQVPGTIIIKLGTPVVSSEEIDGQSWFVQAHEFALFSQKAGVVEVPPFPVRYASRAGFTGPSSDVAATFPGLKVTIVSPPGNAHSGFLITTESLELKETWVPEPGPAQAGAIFKRTISQRASQLSGMALAPAPDSAPNGIKVYSEDAKIEDKTERGDFTGERIDTVTYQLIKAGTFTLPELNYIWWNPKTETMEKSTLPPVSFDVTAAPSSTPTANQGAASLAWILLPLTILAFAVWQREKIISWVKQYWKKRYPADKVLAKKFLRACRQNNGVVAGKAWIAWRNTQGPTFRPGTELQSAVVALQRHLFGPSPAGSWQGIELAQAFSTYLKSSKKNKSRIKASVLPHLNS